MPANRHKSIAKRARKAHASRPTKRPSRLTPKQQHEAAAANLHVAKQEAHIFAQRHSLQSRIDDLESHAVKELMRGVTCFIPSRSDNIESFLRGVVRRGWRDWSVSNLRRPGWTIATGSHGVEKTVRDYESEELTSREGSPEGNAEANEQSAIMAAAFANLSPRDREIIQRCVIDGEWLKHVGESLGYSLNRIHQFRNEALEKLKRLYDEQINGPAPDLFNQAA